MKRNMLQIFRLLVTVVVMGTMAMMIFSLRSELNAAQAKAATRAAGEPVVQMVLPKTPDALETIFTRGSCRKFDPERTVSDADLEQILRAGLSAPTAMDRRPWEFVVVRDAAKLKAIGEQLPYSRVGNGAPLAIVVCGTLDNGLPGRGREYWIQDCSAASMNILLAAHALGYGAVWTAAYPAEERIRPLREILGIPPTHCPLNVIPIGVPAEPVKAKDKWNPAKIHTDQWHLI